MCEDVEASGGEQLQRQGQAPGLRVRLIQQDCVQVLQGGRLPGEAPLQIVLVDLVDTAAQDGPLLRPQLTAAHDLLTQGHDKLDLQQDRVILPGVVGVDVHGVNVVGAAGGYFQHSSAQGLDQRGIFPVRVHHQNIIGVVWVQDYAGQFILCQHGFSRAGQSDNKPAAVEEIFPIAENEVVGDGVDAVVDAARLL